MKGQETLVLTAFLIFIVIVVVLQSIGVDVPVISSALEHEVQVRKDVYTMDNALDAAGNYLDNAARYSTYQSCYDSLRKPSNLINELLFVQDVEDKMQQNINGYTVEQYRFLAGYKVNFPEFTAVVRPITGSGLVSAAKPAYIEQQDEEEKETVRLERTMQASFQLPCYTLYKHAADQYTEVYNNVYSIVSAETLKLPLVESSGDAANCNELFQGIARLSIDDAAARAKASIEKQLAVIRTADPAPNIDSSFKTISVATKISASENTQIERPTGSRTIHCIFDYDFSAVISGTIRERGSSYPVLADGDIYFKPVEASFVQRVSTSATPSTAPTPFDELIAQAAS